MQFRWPVRFWPPDILPRLYLYPLVEGDLDELMAIEQVSFAQPWTRNVMAAELSVAHNIHIGARWGHSKGFVVGYLFLWLVLDEVQVHTIASHPALRGQGIAQCLLAAGFHGARQKGGTWASLEVRPSNWAARRLYDKFGFEQVGRRKNYYSSPKEDALLFNLEFSDTTPVLDIT